MKCFNIEGVEFGIGFVTRYEKTLNDLKSVAGQVGIKLERLFEDQYHNDVSVITECGDIHEFLKYIKNHQDDWSLNKNYRTPDGERCLLFINTEAVTKFRRGA